MCSDAHRFILAINQSGDDRADAYVFRHLSHPAGMLIVSGHAGDDNKGKESLMIRLGWLVLGMATMLVHVTLYGQGLDNCFLWDFAPKTALIPTAVDSVKPVGPITAIVTIKRDTLGKISKYVFGNAIAAWAGAHNDPTFVQEVKLLAPSLIRFPGGSWSDGYFWNGVPFDVPDSIFDGTTYNPSTGNATRTKFGGQSGTKGDITTPDQYYALRANSNVAEGLITVNYAYARYGTSADPVARASHMAADWVRYDNGRTKFWEIGNENAGPWEYGWMIDTALNKDGQPAIISGALYGKHFRIFVDSMKAAAKEVGTTIYVGGQVEANNPSPGYMWYFVDTAWNKGFFREVGDKADFYVIHNYYGYTYTPKYLLNVATLAPKEEIDFIRQDIAAKGGAPRPVALTEYNMGLGATSTQATSYINGMQATVLISELIKNQFGLGARWLLLSWIEQMFYNGPETALLYHPRPEFYYLHYLPEFYGDHSVATSSTSSDVLCYASQFSSGETGVVVVNKGATNQLIRLAGDSLRVGSEYYLYSFTGGTDNGSFSQIVKINGHGPDANQWGPLAGLTTIPAKRYAVEDGVTFASPALSVQMILISAGNTILSAAETPTSALPGTFALEQNYPNPFNPSTTIRYQLPVNTNVTLRVYDVLGREIATLARGHQQAGEHSVNFEGSSLSSGIYFYRLEGVSFRQVRKMVLAK
jgi:hypothetical protein